MHYDPLHLASQDAILVLYWDVIAISSSKPISTGINVFFDVIGFRRQYKHQLNQLLRCELAGVLVCFLLSVVDSES